MTAFIALSASAWHLNFLCFPEGGHCPDAQSSSTRGCSALHSLWSYTMDPLGFLHLRAGRGEESGLVTPWLAFTTLSLHVPQVQAGLWSQWETLIFLQAPCKRVRAPL